MQGKGSSSGLSLQECSEANGHSFIASQVSVSDAGALRTFGTRGEAEGLFRLFALFSRSYWKN